MRKHFSAVKRGIIDRNSLFAVRSSVALALTLCVLVMVGNALAGQQAMPPKGPVPSVEAVEVGPSPDFSFQAGKEAPSQRPNHPPIDQIPPMPMPDESIQGEAPTMPLDPGQPIMHDSGTGETRVLPPNTKLPLLAPSRGEGYSGAEGDGEAEELPATFSSDMTKISSPEVAPWRMNAKLVMRFGTSWFVCSGSMRDAETVLTAGHCVYSRDAAAWADEIWVYPGYDGTGWNLPPASSVGAYGWGHSTWMASWTGWTDNGDWNYDAGLVQIDRAVGMLTGWFGWAVGGDCAWHLAATYNNASYPSEGCGTSGLHNGLDMYYWSGHFDSCSSWNRLQVNTSGGCFNAVWGGMSGSGAYYIDGTSRYVHAMCSTSDRSTYGRYTRQWQDWVDYTNNTFIPATRGSAFDLQALDMNAAPSSLQQGGSTTLLNHLASNPTNGTANQAWTFRVYLSNNDTVSSADTLLSTQGYSLNFNAMSSARVNTAAVTIPYNTPPGDYWLGVVYDSATDGNTTNNSTNSWDAAPIHVALETTPPTPNPIGWVDEPYEMSTSSISMTATTASDPTPPVRYYFGYYSSPTGGTGGTSSGWQASASYLDSGLSPNHQYGYRVKARDGNGNEGLYSAVSYDYTDIETPSGIAFGAVTSSSIQAASANIPSGLTRGSSGLVIQNVRQATNSGWKQDNSFWTSGSLLPNTRYGFKAIARNGDASATAASPEVFKHTLAMNPAARAFSNKTSESVQANWGANGNPAGTEYLCKNITLGTNSGWTTNKFWNNTGLSPGTPYTYLVKARNREGKQTGSTNLGTVATRR
jgi:V8-like Glu-specific endopeptidase